MTKEELQRENEQLRRRLAEAEDALRAIREGQVDAIVVDGAAGAQIFSLAGAETVYRLVVETMAEATINVSPDGAILFCNARFGEFVGTPMERLVGHDLSDFVPAGDRDRLRAMLQQCTRKTVKQRIVLRGPGAMRTPVLLTGNALSQGGSVSLCLVAADLTDLESSAYQIEQLREHQRQLEQAHAALRESAQRLRLAHQAARAGAWEWDLRTNENIWSDELWPLYGIDPHRCAPSYDAWLSSIHPDDRDRAAQTVQAAAAAGSELTVEWRVTDSDGSVRWLLSRGEPQRDAAARVVRYLGIVLDITDRKHAEEALRQSEAKYRNLFENMAEEVHFWQLVRDDAGNIKTWQLVDVNPPTLKTWGVQSVEEIRGKTTDEIFGPGATEHYLPIVQKIFTEGAPYAFEDYFPNLDKHFRFTSVPFREHFITTGADITLVKKAQEALRRSEARWNAAIESFAEGAIIATKDEKLIYWNPAARDMHGFTHPDEGLQPLEKTPETFQLWTLDGGRMLELDEWPMRRIKRGEAVRKLELRIRRPDQGWEKVFSYNGAMVETGDGERLIFLSCFDLTELRRAEAALRESEHRFRLALRNAPVSVAAQDRDLRYIWAYNQKSARPDQIIGHFDHEIFTAEEAAHITPIKQRVLEEGIEQREEMWLDRPTGRLYLDICWEPIRDDAGRIVGVASATVDLTPVKLAEESLKQSLAEKEVLLKEIHHRVKNNLQVISSLVSLQADQSKDEGIRAVLRDVTHRVRSMALVHEKLYQSADLARVEFAAYAESLLGYLWRAHGTAASGIRLALDLEPVALAVDVAVPCGLILNELASNALKHAFRGRKGGEVLVSLHSSPEGKVCLRMRDNGTGLPAGLDWRQAPSLGLRLVQMLAGQLRAEVEVSSNRGTEFAFSFEGRNK